MAESILTLQRKDTPIFRMGIVYMGRFGDNSEPTWQVSAAIGRAFRYEVVMRPSLSPCSLTLASTAHAANLVGINGSGCAYASIQDAIDNASANDILCTGRPW